MPFFQHPTKFDNAVLFGRFDDQHLLSTISAHGFVLDDISWSTVEHYYQANKVLGEQLRERIRHTESALQAYKMGNRWFRRKRADFSKVRVLLMTRALYCKTRQNPEVQAFLLATEDHLIAETSQYDHYWGVGRDQRGENQLGKIWMDIRRKLRQDALHPQQEPSAD